MAAALKSRKGQGIANGIITAITISLGLQNIAPDSLRSGGSFITRFKNFVNEVGGRVTGVNLFPDAPHYAQQFSIEGALTNQQTVMGAIALFYAHVAKGRSWAPLKREARKFGTANVTVGVGTGLFNPNAQRFNFGGLSGNQSGVISLPNSSGIVVGQG